MRLFLTLRLRFPMLALLTLTILMMALNGNISQANASFFSALFFGASLLIPLMLFKPNWYIMLPYSRTWLFAFHAVETILFYAAALICYLLIELNSGRYADPSISRQSFEIAAYAAVFFTLVRLSLPTGGERLQQLRAKSFRTNRREIIKVFAAAIAWCLVWHFLSDQPWFYVLFLMAFLSAIVPTSYGLLKAPVHTVRATKRRGYIMFGILSLSSFLFCTWVVYLGPSNSMKANSALEFFGDIPISISRERVKELFLSENIGQSDKLATFAPLIYADIRGQVWKDRTLRCKDVPCLEMSDDFFDKNVPDQEKFAGLYTLLAKCKPPDYGSKCGLLIPSGKRLGMWLTSLAASSEVDVWLNSEDNLKQLIAIKSLGKSKLSESQKTRISELSNSTNFAVASAAKVELEMNENDRNPKSKECNHSEYCRPVNLDWVL